MTAARWKMRALLRANITGLTVWIAGLLSITLTLMLLPPYGSSDWLRRPLHDDAYYFLIVARSVADGAGTTVNGQWVNGFQPLHLLTCLAAGALAGWDTLRTPAVLVWLGLMLHNVGGTLLLWRIGVTAGCPRSAIAFCAVVWLFHPYGQRAAVNGMETSLALAAWLATAAVWLRYRAGRSGAAALGAVLGAAFWARNDAVVLSMAAVLSVLAAGRRGPAEQRLRAVAVIGATAGVIASPWLLFNVWVSGSIVPQSGLAEQAGGLYDFGRAAQIGEALPALARNLLPLPFGLSRVAGGWRASAALALLACAALGTRVAWRRAPELRGVLSFVALAVALLVLVYALLFGAPHMLTRWLAPAVVLSALVSGRLIGLLWDAGARGKALAGALVVLVVAGRVVTAIADSRRPQPTNTWPMLRYVRAVPNAGTVGSYQSGLLSWALPTVRNLDGKVDPAVLRALREDRLAEWIIRSDIDLIVDQDLFGLDRNPVLRAHFDLELPEPGLAVMRRKKAD